MAIKMVVTRTCDRCTKPFGEEQMDYKGTNDALPQIERTTLTIVATSPKGSQVLATYEDLCADCDSAVSNYIKRIRMEKAETTKAKAKPGETAEVSATVSVGETVTATSAPAATPAAAPTHGELAAALVAATTVTPAAPVEEFAKAAPVVDTKAADEAAEAEAAAKAAEAEALAADAVRAEAARANHKPKASKEAF